MYVCLLGVPSPRRLHLERQFTQSVLLSWKPADLPADQVKGYGVYANGELRLMIKGASKTKALLEGIDPEEVNCFFTVWCYCKKTTVVVYVACTVCGRCFLKLKLKIFPFRFRPIGFP